MYNNRTESFESPDALIKPVYFEHLTECQCTNEHFNRKKYLIIKKIS